MEYQTFKAFIETELPLNRKERFYTGTVLPSLLFHNGISNLFEYLKQIPDFPSDININTTQDNFLFYTEYNFKESAGDRNIGKVFETSTGETPDIVIEILKPQKILILIEAKMFQNILQSQFDRQVKAQKENVSDKLKKELNAPAIHVALIPKALNFKPSKDYSITYWDFFIDNQILDLHDNYFYNYLKCALENYSKLVQLRGIASTVIAFKTGLEIYNEGKNLGTWMGREGGKRKINEDIKNGRWGNYLYSTNTLKPERGREGNWIEADEFIDMINSKRI